MSIPISKSKNYKHVDTIKWNVNVQKLKSVDLLIIYHHLLCSICSLRKNTNSSQCLSRLSSSRLAFLIYIKNHMYPLSNCKLNIFLCQQWFSRSVYYFLEFKIKKTEYIWQENGKQGPLSALLAATDIVCSYIINYILHITCNNKNLFWKMFYSRIT